MKKIIVLSLIVLGLITNSCSKESSPVESPAEKKEWTFLLYDDADFYNAYDPLNDFAELVSSDDNINYLVLQDGTKTKGNYYKIGEQHEKIVLRKLDEVNMGDKSTLENYLNYAKKYFPAKRYIIAFYDHGGGWQGTCWDSTSQNDNLTPAEINDALTNSGGVDLALFTAPCLMGSIESAYQLRKSAKYYIGSEDLSGFIFWIGMLNKFDAFLKSNSMITSNSLAETIITLHDQYKNVNGYGHLITMSAINTSKLGNVVESFNKVTNYYVDNIDKYKPLPVENIKKIYTDYCDLIMMLKVMKENETETIISNQLTETINLLNDCIVAECHGDSTIGSYGLNIYYPSKKYTSEIYYSPYGIGLDFKSDCSWDKLISNSLNKLPSSSSAEQLKNIFRLNGYIPK
jgi:Clostripain family